MKIKFRRRRRVDLVPVVSAVTIVSDTRPFKPIARWLEFTWLGVIVDIEWHTTRDANAWSTRRKS